MKQEVIAVVLAGGEGNRFWPITQNKPLFPYMGATTLRYALGDTLPKEITRLVIVTSKENDEEIRALTFSLPHETVIQNEATGMAGALLAAESKLRGSSLLILNGDDINDVSLVGSVIQKAIQTSAFGVIPGWKVSQYLPFGYLVLAGEKITDIVEKPGAGNEPSEYVNLVTHYIEDADILFDEMKKVTSEKDDVYEKTLAVLMKSREFVMQSYEGGFASLKYPWHVLSVMDELLKRLKPHKGNNVEIKENVIIEGDVYIDDDVKIFENTKITGPCYIGKGTIIGNGNIIRHSHIGARCVTGFTTDITRSYIGDDCWFHSNYIGDSVLEKNISMGSGAVLANLRLDDGEISSVVKDAKVATGRTKLGSMIGSGVRIGVNASIMPGIKIGRDSFIGSGVVLDKDVPDTSYVTVKGGYEIKSNTSQHKDTATRGEFKKNIS